MNKPYFCITFSLADLRHKRLKNKIELLLFYRGHFYRFSESDFALWKNSLKPYNLPCVTFF